MLLRLPILIGGGGRGLSPRALRQALELGNGWITAYLTESELEQGIRQMHEGARSVGRGNEKLIVGLEMFVGMGSSDSQAVTTHSTSLTKTFVSVQEGVKRSLVGTTKTIADKIESYEKTGLDYLESKFIYSTIEDFAPSHAPTPSRNLAIRSAPNSTTVTTSATTSVARILRSLR